MTHPATDKNVILSDDALTKIARNCGHIKKGYASPDVMDTLSQFSVIIDSHRAIATKLGEAQREKLAWESTAAKALAAKETTTERLLATEERERALVRAVNASQRMYEVLPLDPDEPNADSVKGVDGSIFAEWVDALDAAAAPSQRVGRLRPEVRAFAEAIQSLLDENQGEKGDGWKKDKPHGLLAAVYRKTDRLANVVSLALSSGNLKESVLAAAASVAAHAMFVADAMDAL